MIGILDLDICNLKSVSSAVYNLGFDVRLLKNNDKEKLNDITHIIIPGVGSFSNISEQFFKNREFNFKLNQYVKSGKLLLGICLGMQFLATEGYENGINKGLNFFDGKVDLMKINNKKEYSLPHIGWNEIQIKKKHKIFKNISNGSNFYFVHSYKMNLNSKDNIFAETNHSINFPSIVINENVVGFQFHPEKSSKNGLKILENFLKLKS
jgi:glutamine amidotransferase